ncbi:putative secreted protein with PEP-CTERM sorting signal [Nitrosospira multiformis]|uniref:Putative secreted protein with PEP-CTERM sorting signal n=1 Tax=Nitrosospira multiformis TaxID=1231 RepID=A0A2T5I9N0_9PROT|nr:PEP-CTERM sorting domain-containing protein [Nitrosospira multiformis]PTQ80532.1 putative secreted protein with PEP-CTERM sorting signal [Nitrosospira multiformis]
MKATRTTLIKRLIASIIAGMAGMTPIAGAQAALLTINAIIHEEVGYQPHLGCFGGTITGSGVSSLLGSVSIATNDCITSVGNSLSFDGQMTFTVSSGDEIFADYSGWFVPTLYPSIFTLKDSFFSITGGTGSFLGAKGGGKLFGTEDILSGWGLMQATGEISGFKKSKKGTESSLELLNLAGPADENAIVAINELPESGSLALLGIGLASLAFVRRRVSH